MAFTIETLIQALQKAAENSEEGLNTPVLFEAVTSNEEIAEVTTSIDFGSLDVVGYFEGPFLQLEFLINDDQLNRLNWTQAGCP